MSNLHDILCLRPNNAAVNASFLSFFAMRHET